MLFRQKELEKLRRGEVDLAFRRWRRPSVRSGGTLLTAVGQLEIRAVERVAEEAISEEDVRRAGHDSRKALLRELSRRAEGDLYRIELGQLRPDPRIALREVSPDQAEDRQRLIDRLRRLDERSAGPPWTVRTLELIERHPGVRAGDLCARIGQEREHFKLNVRKLKNLGLTESLGTGYRLAPRGAALLGIVRGGGAGSDLRATSPGEE